MPKILRILIPFGVIAGGIFILMTLVKTKPEPKKKERVNPGLLVETVKVATKTETVKVDAKGTVIPAREVVLSPEVSARITWASPQLVPGGRFKAKETVVRLDGRDYRLAVEQQYAQVDRAQTELKLEKARKTVAEKEWELFGPNKKGPTRRPTGTGTGTGTATGTGTPSEVVALREPQMRTAKTAVKAAESGLKRARLAVSKTVIKAPFNAMVRQKNVEIGQLVGPQSLVASLVGTDAFWVQVSVPMDYLSWMKVPGVGATKEGEGSEATIHHQVGKKSFSRTGRVVRLLGDVDPAGRMARILVEIQDPLGLKEKGDAVPMPLLLGSYVRVEVTGGEVQKVVSVPRRALREGGQVFLRKADNTLEIRDVTVLWRREQEVLVGDGLSEGEEVIVSAVSTPVAGLKLRTNASAPKKEDAPADKTGAAEAKEDAEKVAKP